jgi:hypothetical protein
LLPKASHQPSFADFSEKSDNVVDSDVFDGNSTIDATSPVENYPDGHRPSMDTASIFGLVIWFQYHKTCFFFFVSDDEAK